MDGSSADTTLGASFSIPDHAVIEEFIAQTGIEVALDATFAGVHEILFFPARLAVPESDNPYPWAIWADATNAKQIIVSEGFGRHDERRATFAGLIDALEFCKRQRGADWPV